jgi:WD domain, G-beta repeat
MVHSVAVSPDRQWVVSGSFDRSVRFWDLHTGKAQLVLYGDRDCGTSQRVCMPACMRLMSPCAMCVCMHALVVACFHLSQQGSRLVTSCANKSVRLCACLSLVHTKST